MKAKAADRGSIFNLRGDAAVTTVQEILGSTCLSTSDLEHMMVSLSQ